MPDGDSCRIDEPSESETDAIARILEGKRIAVVGLSAEPDRPSFGISQYLQEKGYTIVPVNPKSAEILGEKSFAALADIPGKVDSVLVFRRSEFAADVAKEAAAINATGLWLQTGIVSVDAKKIARDARMHFVQDRCIMVEHSRHRRA